MRKYVDKMIQLAKDGSLHARRQVSYSHSLSCFHDVGCDYLPRSLCLVLET